MSWGLLSSAKWSQHLPRIFRHGPKCLSIDYLELLKILSNLGKITIGNTVRIKRFSNIPFGMLKRSFTIIGMLEGFFAVEIQKWVRWSSFTRNFSLGIWILPKINAMITRTKKWYIISHRKAKFRKCKRLLCWRNINKGKTFFFHFQFSFSFQFWKGIIQLVESTRWIYYLVSCEQVPNW